MDVCVVGGGPAGASAAQALACAGRDVVVLDRASFPRDKCCGDGLTTLALRELEAMDFAPRSIPSWRWLDGIAIRGPMGVEREFRFPGTGARFAAVARRKELDEALVRLAEAKGAQVVTSCKVDAVEHEATHVALRCEGGVTYGARHVIAADGAWSTVRRIVLGTARRRDVEWQAFRGYARMPEERSLSTIWFDADLRPGYAWAFPLGDGYVNFGFGQQSLSAGGERRGFTGEGRARTLWSSLLDREHIAGRVDAAGMARVPRGWSIPCAWQPAQFCSGRVLFVGDAAQVADPMTGEGIGQALVTGRLAAEALVAEPDPAAAGAAYARAVTDALGASLRLSARLGGFLVHRKAIRVPVRVMGATAACRRAFALWLYESVPRDALFTAGGWVEMLRHPRGAFAVDREPAMAQR